jgi:hypothetical protein
MMIAKPCAMCGKYPDPPRMQYHLYVVSVGNCCYECFQKGVPKQASFRKRSKGSVIRMETKLTEFG